MKTAKILPLTLGVVGALAATVTFGCSDDTGDGLFGGGGEGAGSTTASGPTTSGPATSNASSTAATGTSTATGSTSTGGDPCGDGTCEPAECGVCSFDCGPTCQTSCGNNTCDANETCMTCPADCATGCGDGCCLLGENCQNCAQDCITVESCDPSACGNGVCNYGLSETCLNCLDCVGLCDCGDQQCVSPETPANCPWDCG
jgi:hypothetical protein